MKHETWSSIPAVGVIHANEEGYVRNEFGKLVQRGDFATKHESNLKQLEGRALANSQSVEFKRKKKLTEEPSSTMVWSSKKLNLHKFLATTKRNSLSRHPQRHIWKLNRVPIGILVRWSFGYLGDSPNS